MNKPVILVTAADLATQALSLLTDCELVFAGKSPTDAQIVELCATHNPAAIIVRYGKVGAAAMDAAPNLKVISKHGSGIDTIDKSAADKRGVAVVAASGANAAAVAEHAVALMLACAKSVVQLDTRMREGHWDKATHKSVELDGKVVGVVGYGAIGRRFSSVAHAMGMSVLVYDPFATEHPGYVSMVDLESIFSKSDVISLHCPLTDSNRGLLNDAALAKCKHGVIIVNTARGGLIDEQALLAAIQSGLVASAGLDSFVVEPMMNPHPFQGEPRIILSPHVGGVTSDAYVKMGVQAAINALQILERAPVST